MVEPLGETLPALGCDRLGTGRMISRRVWKKRDNTNFSALVFEAKQLVS